MDSQCKLILAHLRKGWSITYVQALRDYGCARLAARIKDLRNAGHPIGTMMVVQGKGKRFACYYLMKRKPSASHSGARPSCA